MSKLTTTITLITTLFTATAVNASTHNWKPEFDHGELRAYVHATNGNMLDVVCSPDDLLSFEYSGTDVNISSAEQPGLMLQVDNNPIIQVTDDGTRAAANRIYQAMRQLKQGKTLIVRYNNVSDTFTLKKAAAFLPTCHAKIDADM